MTMLKFESISVEAFTVGVDQYAVFAQPFTGTCSFMEWDHVNMEFRPYDMIESESQSLDVVWLYFDMYPIPCIHF